MRIIWLICLIGWSVLMFKVGEMREHQSAQRQFDIITDDALSKIRQLKMEKQALMQICQMQEEMCIEDLNIYEKNLFEIYIMLFTRESALKYLFKEYHCFKKEEI
jgi:hypothetical protein